MKRLNKRELMLGIMTVVLLFAYMVMQNIIKPMQEQVDNVQRRAQLSQVKYVKMRKTLAQGPAVAQRYAKLEDVLGKSRPAKEEMSDLMSKLQLLAGEYSVRIGQINPQRVLDRGDVVFYPVHLDISGKWSDVARFIARAQAGPDYMFLSVLRLQKSGDAAGTIAGTLTLSRMRLKSVL